MSIRHLIYLYLWRARKRKSLGYTLILAILVTSLFGNALAFYLFDGPGNPDLTMGDCLWYSVISIATIGYGDLSAQSAGARIGTVVFIVFIGLVAFTTFFGMVLDWFIDLNTRERKGMCRIYEKDHILIVNFPSAQRVLMVLDELCHDAHRRNRAVVIISDQITELPFTLPGVSFVHGSPIEEETYDRANIEAARKAIVLCISPGDPNSDSVVASIVSMIEHIKPDLFTVAECLSEKHQRLFESCRCDSIVFSNRIINNLLVHESLDKGVIRLVDVITTHKRGDTIFTLEVEETGSTPLSSIHMAKVLLDHAVNLLCVNRGGDTFTDFTELDIERGDVLVYISKGRKTWDDLKKILDGAG